MSSGAIRILVLAASVAAAGCAPEEQACDAVMGVYQGTYTYIDGNCAFMQQTAGPFDMTSSQATSTMMLVRVDDMIITEVIKQGCTVQITRKASREGATLWQMEGKLDVESEDVLSGPMVRYEWLNGAQVCGGTYDVMMQRQVPTTF
jgi:hypothetical protein